VSASVLGAPRDSYISVVRLSAFNLSDDRRVAVVMKSYNDGAGKSHHVWGHMTLASLSAPDAVWPEFETAWRDTLDIFGLRWWHTTDAMSPDGPRDFLKPEKTAWDMDIAERARVALSKLTHDSLGRLYRRGFQIITCTISLPDYWLARDRNWFLRNAEAICVNDCLGYIFLDDDGLGEIYFDHGEAFMKEVEQVWTKDRTKSGDRWAKQIAHIGKADTHQVCALQAADLLAWELNRAANTAPEVDPAYSGAKRVIGLFGRTHTYYDLEEIEKEYPLAKERDRAERIVKARRNTREARLLKLIQRSNRDA
jgi:hypothetical protein